ncbi:MAG: tRNA lysidine(34) synthetase TilS, partial [Chloroflexota bacterium]|nr:tRNA lysidine(34) synthetase TilS [Chloroflexota bacterium]
FDAAALAALGPLVLRTRRPGDRLAPFGAGGHTRKLQDLLVDGGVPRAVRAGVPLLAVADGPLLWLPGPGGRRSGAAPLTPVSVTAVIFTFIPRATAYQADAQTVDG